MEKVKKEEILVPLLEKYQSNRSYYDRESIFYSRFEDLISGEKDLHLSEPFGISILITNIVENKIAEDLRNSLESNTINFVPSHYRSKNKDDKEVDEKIFEKNVEFSLKRYVFKSNERIKVSISNNENITGFIDAEDEETEISLFFSIFISIAKTNLGHHIVSFIFTTYDFMKNDFTDDDYTTLSNKQIIKLINGKSKEFNQLRNLKKFDKVIENNYEELLMIRKTTFIGLHFWRADWKGKSDNNLDVTNYINENPYFFYSLLTMDTDIYRRNYKNIMDYLGWCFSASRVHCGLFSRNAYISLTLKPLKGRFDYLGLDGTEIRLWEILSLQNYILYNIDLCHAKPNPKNEAYCESLIEELNKIYDFNAILSKTGKGEIWIKFNTYLQDIIGITSYYNLYINRHNKKLENDEIEKGTRLTYLNLLLSSLILATIFLTIAIYFLSETKNNLHLIFIKNSLDTTINATISEILASSIRYTGIISFLSIFIGVIAYSIIDYVRRNW